MKGNGVSKGVALAVQVLLDRGLTAEQKSISNIDEEIAALRAARAAAVSQLTATSEETAMRLGAAEQEVFEAQLLLLDSDELWTAAEEAVEREHKCAQWAFDDAIEARIAMFSELDSAYLRERVLDLQDIRQRVLRCMRRDGELTAGQDGDLILVGSEIMPSQLTEQRGGRVCGLAMEAGGTTSHTVLLANMMGIPCVIGAAGLLEQAVAGEEMLVDGDTGEVTPHPSRAARTAYREKCAGLEREAEQNRQYMGRPDQSKDGAELPIWCNIVAVQDVERVLENDGGGVGLMRSEFLFLERSSAPIEEEQYAAYRQTAQGLGGRPLIIRTLDVGGDKQVPYLQIEPEANPFLGVRAIRYCLEHEEIFLPQLRAILRAGADEDVRVMFPMIASLSELRSAKGMLARAKEQLREAGVPFRADMPVGIMIEIPAAAIMAEDFAREADFFSIGTNDLTQYLNSADRGNPKLSALNQPYAPALLRLVADVARKGHEAGIPVAICGHAGQDPLLLPLWLAMGIGELSVSPKSVLELRRILSNLTKAECVLLLKDILRLQTAEEILSRLREVRRRGEQTV